MGASIWTRFGRWCRRGTGWLLLALLLASLAPSISRALAPDALSAPGGAPGAGWVEVCGPGGVRWVAVAEPAASTPDDPAPPASAPGAWHGDALDHCAYCWSCVQAVAHPLLPPAMPPAAAQQAFGPLEDRPAASPPAFFRPRVTGPPGPV
ncbi:DUF2946 family protein [uncultured Hydrogenophaga sp.]|uniref:DUF2946 family protein n=1 Tax=uncultured Hydrogenophaga sp. TaxID=199683 RepID=UPI00265FA531|nr:DUF2946 family protein [uncultured Hydrogenophaga sp.]